MKITNKAIQFRTSIVVLTVLLVIGGLYSYVTIPKESFPSIEIPNIVVTTIYPGASPDDIESLITQQIEREIQSVNGIKEIRSTSTEGVSTVVVEFNPEISIDDAFQKIRDKVDIAKPDLPSDAEEPIVSEIDLQEFPVATLNLAADYPLTRLKEVADDLADELETIPSVLEVDVIGALEREVQINVDLQKLKGYNIAFEDIVSAIAQENTNIPGGSVDVDRLNYLVRVNGEFNSPQEINDLVIDTPGGRAIYVRDVANVDFGFKDRSSYSRLQVLQIEDDEDRLVTLPVEETGILPVISLNVKKRSGANILETDKAIAEKLSAFPLPSGTRVEITGDMAEQVLVMVKDLENNIISGLIFVVAVLLFFLGVRNAFLVGIAIPLSMFIAFILFSAMGYTLNFVILFSLIIALGMLVDNAVVIVENIYRFREQGKEKFDAAREGTAEVAMPVVASTATTVAAFAPMLFWPGIMGEFMSYLPLTLIVTLSCSLFVALIINPVVTGIFVRLEGEHRPPLSRTVKMLAVAVMILLAAIVGFANYISLFVLTGLAVVFYYVHKYVFKPIADRFVQEGLPRLLDRYRELLRWMLERDYSVRYAYLRNTLALGSFTVGFIFLIIGGLVAGLAGMTAAFVPLALGCLGLIVGVLGILFHTFESIFAGRMASVRLGLGFAAVMGVILALMSLSDRSLTLGTVANLMIMPAIIIVVGLAGVVLAQRTQYVLTDNRAKLLTGVFGGLFAIIGMFGVASPGTELFPDTDPTMIQVTIEGDLGTNLEESNKIAAQAHDLLNTLLEDDAVSRGNLRNIQTSVGTGGDAFFGGGAASPERSTITLNLVDYDDRGESSKKTMQLIRDQLLGIPGTELEFTKDNAGPPTGAPVNIEISGPDFSEIVRLTSETKRQLNEAIRSGAIPGLTDVGDNLNTGRPELRVTIDRERAARAGLNTSMIASTIRAGINGIEAGKYRDGEDEYDITVRLAKIDRGDLESLKNLTILNEDIQIPVVSVADFEVTSGLGSVTRLDLERVATVTGDVFPDFNKQVVLAEVQDYLADFEQQLPAGYSMSYTGESEEQDAAFGFLTNALLIAIALIFMILVAQFNRISLPFIIMVAVGLSLIGVLLGLILTRTPFGLMTFIGVISLAGIVVNNNIVLIDYIIQLRERGLSRADAIIEGGATRLRPVTLTALTTVIGLIPLTFGIGIDFVGLIAEFKPNFQLGSANTQFWGPMGTSIISGLTFATFLTLVIVPVLYSAFESLSSRLGVLFKAQEAGVSQKVDLRSSDAVTVGGNGSSGDGVVEPITTERPT